MIFESQNHDGEILLSTCSNFDGDITKVQQIIDKNPNSVTYFSEDGYPPLWFACNHGSLDQERYNPLILILIRASIRFFFWPGTRGGLLVKFSHGQGTYSPLELLVKMGNYKMLKILAKNQKYPLLISSDVVEYRLLDIVRDSNVTNFLVDLNPIASSLKDKRGNYPVQYIHMNWIESPFDAQNYWKMLTALAKNGILHGVDSFGGLFLPKKNIEQCKIEEYRLLSTGYCAPIDLFITCSSSKKWSDFVGDFGYVFKGRPIVQDLLKSLPPVYIRYHISNALEVFDCIESRDDKGRLPLHAALDCGLGWNEGLEEILQAGNDKAFREIDLRSGLHAIALAAEGDEYSHRKNREIKATATFSKNHCCDLDTIYILLRKHTSHLFLDDYHITSSRVESHNIERW